MAVVGGELTAPYRSARQIGAELSAPGAAQPMPEHTGQCPSCGGGRIRVIMISEDGLRILACYDCRWSGIIQEVPHGA